MAPTEGRVARPDGGGAAAAVPPQKQPRNQYHSADIVTTKHNYNH